MAAKVRMAMNAVWGIWKRAEIKSFGEKVYLMDAIVRAGCLYGVEIWGGRIGRGWKRYREGT